MKKQHIKLTSSDQDYLNALLKKGSLKVMTQKRALGLLELNKGRTYVDIADLLQVNYNTVMSWAKKYKEVGLSFLNDRPRSGRPIKLSGEELAKITALACSEPPKGYSRWSLRMLADKVVELEIVDSISFKQVGLILKKMNYSLTEKDSGASVK